MTWLAIRFLLAGWAKSAWAFLCRHPWQTLLIASLIWGGLGWHGKAAERDRADKCAIARKADKAASQAAAAATEAMRAQERAKYKEQANDANQHKQAADHYVRDATERHIAGLHKGTPRVSAAKPIGQSRDAGQPSEVPSGFVLASEADLRTAAEWQAYGVTCHDYLQTITEN